jgi:PAS domain S-box-containing protein
MHAKRRRGRGIARRTDVFDLRIGKTSQIVNRLALRAAGLPEEQRALFAEALAELQTTLEELQVAGEELVQQADELAAARKDAEEGQRRYLGLFDLAPDAYLVTDGEGMIIEANQRACGMLGLRPDSLLKKPLVLYVDRSDRKAFFEKLAGLRSSGGLENWEIRFRSRGGRALPGHVDVTVVDGSRGAAAEFRWLIRDATEAKKREEMARLASFPEKNPEPVIEVDMAGHVYYLNPAARRVFRDLPERGLAHPWLAGLREAAEKLETGGRRSLTQEIQVDGRFYLRTIASGGSGERLRVYGRDITYRKAVEELLRKSELDYRDLVDNANAIIIRWKPGGEITYCNRFARSFFGYEEDELLGLNVEILIPQTDSRGLDLSNLVERIAAFPDFYASHENENVLRDGRRVWIRWTNKALFDEGGKIREVLAIGNDITDRCKAEEALRNQQEALEDQVRERTEDLLSSTELLESVFASVGLAIAYLDKDFRFIRVNRAFAEAFGGDPERFAGTGLFDIYPDERVRDIFQKTLETGRPCTEYESPFLFGPHRLEGTCWDWSLQRVMSGGEVRGLVLSMVDVTKRIRAEEEQRRLSAAIAQSGEAVVITDERDRIVYANPTFSRLHGLEESRVPGRLYGEILGFDREDESFWTKLREALDRSGVWKGRLTRPVGDIAEGKLDLTISAVRDPSGQVENYAILERDVTNEHRLEASVRNLQKLDALGALAGGIAHDFNNILVPIFINAEMAAFEAEKGGQAYRSLQLVLEAASRGRELVRQIIAFSRPTEQKRDIIDMTAVVKETARFLRSSIPKSIAIVERYDVASGRVRADPTQISQVLMNLGSNAAHAMREQGGRLAIGLSDVTIGARAQASNPELKPGHYVRMTVADDGSGIPPEILERIFDPFFTTKRRGEGTGMGLSVVRGIVRSHGGAIEVSSAPGKGTAFEIYLPAAKGKGRVEPSAPGQALTGKGRILFVDDEELLVRSVRPMLERLGFSVSAMTDPLEALAFFRDRPGDFDLVITDELMPGLTGEKLAHELLRIRPDVPIILTTGFSETVREDELPAMGIRGLIMKPFSTSEIAEKIQDALKKA